MSLTVEDHVVFQLDDVSVEDVVEARFGLFQEAIVVIENARKKTGEDYKEQLERLRLAYLNSLKDQQGRYQSLSILRTLSHHGLRSFVDFLASIRIDYRSDYDVISRLFVEQSYNLVRLYITNLKKRYTEKDGHFNTARLGIRRCLRASYPHILAQVPDPEGCGTEPRASGHAARA